MISLQQELLRLVICDDVKLEEAPVLIEAVRLQHRRLGKKLYYLAVIPEEAPVPDTAVRNTMAHGLRDIHECCDYTGLGFCGHGFKASAKRAVFAAMLLAIMKGKWHIGSSIDELIAKSAGQPERIDRLRTAAYLAEGRGYRV